MNTIVERHDGPVGFDSLQIVRPASSRWWNQYDQTRSIGRSFPALARSLADWMSLIVQPHALTKILYVDGDDDIRTVAVFAPEVVGGFEVTACASGREALARAVDFAPQLLLLDVMMPDRTGPPRWLHSGASRRPQLLQLSS